MSRRLQIVLGLVLAIVLLFLFFRQTDLGAVVEHLTNADPGLLVLALALSVLTTVQRAWRWQYLLAPLKWIGLRSVWECTVMGWSVTTVLPGRLGEIARPLLLARRDDLSRSASLATVVLERVFDVFAVIALLALYLLAFPLPAALDAEGRAVIASMRVVGVLGVGGLIGVVVVTVLAYRSPDRVKGMFGGLVTWLPERPRRWLSDVGSAFARGLAGMREPRLILVAAAQSLLIWGTVAAYYWIVILAFDLDVPYYAVIPLMTLIVIGVMVPTPAGVGSFHAAARIGLATLWGVPNEPAVSYAIASHAVAFLPMAVLGLPLLWWEGLSIGELDRMGEAAHPRA